MPLFAQTAAETSLRVVEWSPPATPLGWAVLLGVGALLIAWTVRLDLRDTRGRSPLLRFWLMTLRLGVIAGLALVVLNPEERTQTTAERPSRVLVLLDTSLSMSDPAASLATAPPADGEEPVTRSAAVAGLLADSPLLAELRARHAVEVFTFDTAPAKVAALPRVRDEPEAQRADVPRPPGPVWPDLLTPTGLETRLGESLVEVLRRGRGPSLAGVVVLSDGGLNAGTGADSAAGLAARDGVPVFTVGVGGSDVPANLAVTDVVAPTDVRFGKGRERQDPFEVRAFLTAEQLGGRTARVELLRRRADAPPDTDVVIDTAEFPIPAGPDDGGESEPLEVAFELEPEEPGTFRYTVRAAVNGAGAAESRADDDARGKTVRVLGRNTAVLVIAGGPSRDYRFLRTALARSATVEADVWLQTVRPEELPGVSQEADDLLVAFPPQFPLRPAADRLPDTGDAARTYDVVIALDADWSALPPDGRQSLVDFVDRQRGGLVFLAGTVSTPRLADAGPDFAAVRQLLPVNLASQSLLELAADSATQPWPVGLTDAGRDASPLRLDPDAAVAGAVWTQFPGFYHAYPTRGPKDLATVLALHTDPRSGEDGPAVLAAEQRFGSGKVLYLGSDETWRLRVLGEEFFERLWTQAIRSAGEGRLRGGDEPVTFLVDRDEYLLGEPIPVRVRLQDQRGRPVDGEPPALAVQSSGGDERSLPAELRPSASRPGQYEAVLRPTRAGRLVLTVTPPDGGDPSSEAIEVRLPKLEQLTVRQDRALLTSLADATGGEYLSLSDAATRLPALLPDRTRTVTIDERLRALWDRTWVLALLVGLLGVEWLTRKLARLA